MNNPNRKKKNLPPIKKKPPEFSFSLDEVYKYDIPGMKAPSFLENVKNPRYIASNKPKPKNKRVSSKKKLGKIKKTSSSVTTANLLEGKNLSGVSDILPYLKDIFIGKEKPSDLLLEETNRLLKKSRSQVVNKKSNVAPDDEKEIKRLKTGEDAVAFFSKAGKNTAVKFVYLNRAGASKTDTIQDLQKREYRPYSLEVVSHEKVNPEYFTMSATGVVHIQPNQPTEYMSLADWMKESTMFNVLRRIKFFKYYLAYKCFKLWYKNSRYQSFDKKRESLAKNFFLTKKSFSSTLQNIHKNCYELQDIEIMDFNNKTAKNGAFEKNNFIDQQQKIRSIANEKFSNLMIEGMLQSLCKTVSSRIRNMNSPEAIRAFLSGRNVSSEESKQMQVKKSKSMFESQQEDKERKLAIRKAKKEKNMLGDFIRLSDYMTIESLISLCKNTLLRMYREMEWDIKRDKNAQRIMFNVYIQFDEKGDLVYTPTEEQLYDLFQKNSADMIETVSKIPRLLTLRSFKNYFHPSEIGKIKWKIDRAIFKDEVFSKYNNSVEKLVETSFKRTVEFGKKFEKLNEEFKFVNSWDDNEYFNKKHNHESFSTALSGVDRSLKFLKWSMQTNKDCGFLRVDSKKLKNYLEPRLERILMVIKKTINYSSRKMCVVLIESLKKKITELDQKPSTLQKFAIFVDTLNKINSESEKIQNDIEEIQKIYELAISNRDKSKSEELKYEEFEGYENLSLEVLQEIVNQTYAKFGDKKNEAEIFKTANIAKNTKELDSKINDVDEELMKIEKILESEIFTSSSTDSDDVQENLKSIGDKIESIKKKTDEYNHYKNLFRDHPLEWTSLQKVEDLFKLRKDIWESLFQFDEKSRDWMNSDIKSINADEINKYVTQTLKHINSVIQVSLDEKFGKGHKDDVVEYLMTLVLTWKDKHDVLTDIGNKNMTEPHWKKIFTMIGAKFAVTTSYTYLQLESFGIFQHKDIVREVSQQATGEATLQQYLDEIEKKWKTTDFVLKQHLEKEDTYILGNVELIFQQIEEHQVLLQKIQSNEYVMGVKVEVDDWEEKLSDIFDIIDEWMKVQNKWLHLEHIFDSEDNRRQLHEENAKFSHVNELFKKIMKFTKDNKSVLALIDKKRREEKRIDHLSILHECNEFLDNIRYDLEDFLSTKRNAFPRFYFLSDEELLELISKKKSVREIKDIVTKCFDGISSLKLQKEGSNNITGITSPEGSYMRLRSFVWGKGNVEFWMQKLLRVIEDTLREEMSNALKSYREMTKKEWIFENHPPQCIQSVERIVFSSDVEKAFDEVTTGDNIDAVGEFKERYRQQLSSIIEILKKSEISSNQRILLHSLVQAHILSIDILDTLISEKIFSPRDDLWQKQLRFYWNDPQQSVQVNLSNFTFQYGFEYLGNCERIVITPTTVECFLSLADAMNNLSGGCLQGKTGVGKTETIKELSRILGRQCFVFNCTNEVNVKLMNRFFSGIVQSGTWAIFEEVNRIDQTLLGVIGQYMKIIQNALESKAPHFIFEDKTLFLNSDYSAFFTINLDNPIKYHTLPDNLKEMFRVCTIKEPDTSIIIQTVMQSLGFTEVIEIASYIIKFQEVYNEKFKKKYGIEFELRAMKRIIENSGENLHKLENKTESSLVCSNIKEWFYSFFSISDCEEMEKLLNAIIGKEESNEAYDSNIIKAIEEQLKENNLIQVDEFVKKIVQLNNTLDTEKSVIITGGAGTGKTTLYKILAETRTKLSHNSTKYKKTLTMVINPSTVSYGNLFGKFESKKWKEGLISRIFKKIYKEGYFVHYWIIFDGYLSSKWIDTLGTLLDDSNTLFLQNGERIKLPSTTRFIFEVEDISNASPSLMGRSIPTFILEEAHMDGVWRPLFESWCKKSVEKFGEEVINVVKNCGEQVLGTTLHHIKKDGKLFLPVTHSAIIHSFTAYLNAFLDTSMDDMKLVKMVTMFCYIWSMSGCLSDESKTKFDSFAKVTISEFVEFPEEGTVFDYFVDKQLKTFENWEKIIEEFSYKKENTFYDVMVPTKTTTSAKYIMKQLIARGENVLLCSEKCGGKSLVMRNFVKNVLKSENPESEQFGVIMDLNGKISQNKIQRFVNFKLPGKSRKVIGDSTGRKVVLCVEDVNIPDSNEFPLETIRQMIDQGGLYNEKNEFRDCHKINFLATCGKQNNDKISKRFLRHFAMLHIPAPGEEEQSFIFKKVLDAHLSQFSDPIKLKISNISNVFLKVYNSIKSEFGHLEKDEKLRGIISFNFRDLWNVLEGVIRFSESEIKDLTTLLKLYVHEMDSIFLKKLQSPQDMEKYKELINKLLTDEFGSDDWKNEEARDIFFGIFCAKKKRVSLESVSMKNTVILEETNQIVDEYNFEKKENEKLQFFNALLGLFNRVCHSICIPYRHAVLVGDYGSGRKILCKLASFLDESEFFEYNTIENEMEDIRNLCLNAGLKGKKVVLLLEDCKTDVFKEIYDLITSGEILGLFSYEDFEKIVNKFGSKLRETKKNVTNDSIFSHFLVNVKKNMHIVLCVKNDTNTIRDMFINYPSIPKQSEILYFNQWHEKDLEKMCFDQISEIPVLKNEEKSVLENLSKLCVKVHTYDVEENEKKVNLRTFYEFSEGVGVLITKKKKDLQDRLESLQKGITKLKEFKSNVEDLKKSVDDKKSSSGKELEKSDKLTEKLKIAKKELRDLKEDVEKKEQEVKAFLVKSLDLKKESNDILEGVTKKYESALDSVKNIKEEELSNIKNLLVKDPPEGVKLVLEAVSKLLSRETNLENLSELVSDISLVSMIEKFEKDDLVDVIPRVLKDYVENEEFKPEKMEEHNIGLKYLCEWVIAVYEYSRASFAKNEYEKAKKVFDEKELELNKSENRVIKMEEDHSSLIKEVSIIKEEIDQAEKKLKKAELLGKSLENEEKNWSDESKLIQRDIDNVIGDCVLEISSINIFGTYSMNERKKLMEKWKEFAKECGVSCNENFTLRKNLNNEILVRDWIFKGLNEDDYSIENAILVYKAEKYPLIIDSQEKAGKWIGNIHSENGLRVIDCTDKNYLKKLEKSIRTGSPTLLENISNKIDHRLNNLIKKEIKKKGGRIMVEIGGNEVDFNEGFKLYMITNMEKPEFSSDVYSKTTVVNFDLPEIEIKEKSDAVSYEKLDLEQERENLIKNIMDEKLKLKIMEERLLENISRDENLSILKDLDLLNSLHERSMEINSLVSSLDKKEERLKGVEESLKEFSSIKKE